VTVLSGELTTYSELELGLSLEYPKEWISIFKRAPKEGASETLTVVGATNQC
jgi:hypothetical protein